MDETLSNIDWTAANAFRIVSLILLGVGIMEMVMMMSHYWWRIIPLRKEVTEHKIVAPPVVWTFCYHIAVAATLVIEFITKFQLVIFGGPDTASTWLSPVVTLLLVVSVHFFAKYYSDSLNHEQWDRFRR